MQSTISIGIDLGTTNSAIAQCSEGRVRLFTNPKDLGRRTLPSVVAFRGDRIFIGTKARERMEKDPANVVGRFKRKMGTSERFAIAATGATVSPIELSAHVLRELKTFLPDGVTSRAAVITIPASFDTVQSNATKEAGYQAGFEQVKLLQEPIAASLAFANWRTGEQPLEGRWLVYDLGGGTFDAALISIHEGEMKVRDHVGDNFLGGTDFDRLIVEQLIIPALEEQYRFSDLRGQMLSHAGRYNHWYQILLQRAEEAKIQLSTADEAEIILEGEVDDAGASVDCEIEITRDQFDALITPYIDGTLDLVTSMIDQNGLQPSDLEFVLLVGGSTYIPLVRQRLAERLGVPVNARIDPTTCVAEGAAHYAASQPLRLESADTPASAAAAAVELSVRLAYPRVSRDREETLVGRVEGPTAGCHYRLLRADGGYDSGLKALGERLYEDLPLLPDALNQFTLHIYDARGAEIDCGVAPIAISSGYAISGQPLPADISLEIDDPERPGRTRCLSIFEKNAVLPLRRTLTRMLNRGLRKGHADEVIRINILEGPAESSPEANRKIGFLEISGRQLARDLSRGTDVEIDCRINENRDLTVAIYLTMSEQEFVETFVPTERHTPLHLLRLELDNLVDRWAEEEAEAHRYENYEILSAMRELQPRLDRLRADAQSLREDDMTDARYQLEDQRRELVRRLDQITQGRELREAVRAYREALQKTVELTEEAGDDEDYRTLEAIRRRAKELLRRGPAAKIENLTRELDTLRSALTARSPKRLIKLFEQMTSLRFAMTDAQRAETLVMAGQTAIREENWTGLTLVIVQMQELIPEQFKQKRGFGGAGQAGKIGF